MKIEQISPVDGRVTGTYTFITLKEELYRLIDLSYESFLCWREKSFSLRSSLLNNLAKVLRDQAGEIAAVMAREMGKPLSEGVGEANKCAWVCDYYAKNGEAFLQDEEVSMPDAGSRGLVTYRPLGPILAVMPWNFPFWQVIRCAAPIIMAGNTMILKHASNIPKSALMIEDLFRKAGFPPHVFTTLLIGSGEVSTVIEHKNVRGVTLTGSSYAGSKVAQKAGEMIKKTVMELGGSDPYIILDDADLEIAAELVVKSRLLNAGQTCIAAKRYIVFESVGDRFTELVREQVKKVRVGDPLDESTDMGPLARFNLRDELHRQVLRSVEMGARCLLGGTPMEKDAYSSGAYYHPTILTEVKKGMPAYDEEIFGPVISIITVRDDQEALEVANDSSFGLGSGVFSEDVERARKLALNIETGLTSINDFVKSDPRLPFGGVKGSGYGRELSLLGIREFTNIKTIVTKDALEP